MQQIPDALSDFNVNLVITTSFKITHEKPIKLFLAYFYAIVTISQQKKKSSFLRTFKFRK